MTNIILDRKKQVPDIHSRSAQVSKERTSDLVEQALSQWKQSDQHQPGFITANFRIL
jgi:hypothetical protein